MIPEDYVSDEDGIKKLHEKYPAVLNEVPEEEIRKEDYRIIFELLKDHMGLPPKYIKHDHMEGCKFEEKSIIYVVFKSGKIKPVYPMEFVEALPPRNGKTIMEIIGNTKNAIEVNYAFKVTKMDWEKHDSIRRVVVYENPSTDLHKYYQKEIKRRALPDNTNEEKSA